MREENKLTLAPRLGSIEAMFRKLEREAVRAFHHPSLGHKADHFYNFCITAHSLRDYLMERLGKHTQEQQSLYVQEWTKEACIVAVADIANTAKHFVLRRRDGRAKAVKTRRVSASRTTYFDILLGPSGNATVEKRRDVPTISITLECGLRMELSAFMQAVLEFWRRLLIANGIKIKRQSWRSLHGRSA